jgi:hypothetical protein
LSALQTVPGVSLDAPAQQFVLLLQGFLSCVPGRQSHGRHPPGVHGHHLGARRDFVGSIERTRRTF